MWHSLIGNSCFVADGKQVDAFRPVSYLRAFVNSVGLGADGPWTPTPACKAAILRKEVQKLTDF